MIQYYSLLPKYNMNPSIAITSLVMLKYLFDSFFYFAIFVWISQSLQLIIIGTAGHFAKSKQFG